MAGLSLDVPAFVEKVPLVAQTLCWAAGGRDPEAVVAERVVAGIEAAAAVAVVAAAAVVADAAEAAVLETAAG